MKQDENIEHECVGHMAFGERMEYLSRYQNTRQKPQLGCKAKLWKRPAERVTKEIFLIA